MFILHIFYNVLGMAGFFLCCNCFAHYFNKKITIKYA